MLMLLFVFVFACVVYVCMPFVHHSHHRGQRWNEPDAFAPYLSALHSRLASLNLTITIDARLSTHQTREWLYLMMQKYMFQPLHHIELFADSTVARMLPQYVDVASPFLSQLVDPAQVRRHNLTLPPQLSMVSLHVRRGDKLQEDPYWRVYHSYRPLIKWTTLLTQMETAMAHRAEIVFVATDDIGLAANVVEWTQGRKLEAGMRAYYAHRGCMWICICVWL